MSSHADKPEEGAPKGSAPTATFHARVAGVGLITTVVVLLAACLTFMLQQWAVARTQSHHFHDGLAAIGAQMAGPSLVAADRTRLSQAIGAVQASKDVVAGRVTDATGRVVASFSIPQPAETATETITKPILVDGRPAGQFTMTVTQPSLTPMLPQFIALTFVLLFGGVGVALFLARSLAHRVIQPVQVLSQAMHEVAAGGSFSPVVVDASDELFQSLTESFNHLLGKLAEREDDLKGAMRELELARDAANAANVLKTQFLANMSHEIRTPLNGVLAMAEVMALGELGPVQRDRLDVIRRSGGLLLAVLNDVLDLSKIEAGKLTLFEEDFDVEAAIGQARDNFEVMAKAKGLGFDVTVSDEAKGWWRGDADRLRQIIGNLLSNAVKFTPQGTVGAAVDISPAGGLRIVVRDSGVGISPEKLPSLFEKFTQADNSATRRFGGTGLGLAICRELTQMMGGSIDVESREGHGSTFTVELPLTRGRPASLPATETSHAAEDGDLRLLAAEDNPTNQQVLAAVLGSLGIEVHIVPDGKEAVEAWRTGSYDLILMDIQMPVMDGITAASTIREAEAKSGRKRTPIVALTANALTHQVEEYLAVGMDAHVAKPIEIAKLYDAISSVLNAAATGSSANAQASSAA
ncbi:MAG: response regulator [Alphaproteobacteria bacterium]|nr:response regulator [Alphaproteobacteria bacterium]MBU1514166.1 response regulator [Alphaproteobacteria bacterium]MBU2096185.1 response regulator [Alphaproteobacteria bacterium]MBU2151139.1 response regulator [Alphaproteobacteria bacterium]MBU2307202.1 response regulator [Alphaproteobacteria bacterium]